MRGAANRRSVSKRTAQKWAAIAEGAPDLLPEANDDFAPSRAPRKREERETQRKIVSTLRKLLPHGSLVWATPNHARSPEHRFSLMQEGMVAGMPDLFILVRGHGLRGAAHCRLGKFSCVVLLIKRHGKLLQKE